MKRYIIKVYGEVQGVNFRYYTIQRANELELKGWVRNEIDGSVSIVAEGEEENLEKLVKWAKVGPEFAQVSEVKVSKEAYAGEFEGFTTR